MVVIRSNLAIRAARLPRGNSNGTAINCVLNPTRNTPPHTPSNRVFRDRDPALLLCRVIRRMIPTVILTTCGRSRTDSAGVAGRAEPLPLDLAGRDGPITPASAAACIRGLAVAFAPWRRTVLRSRRSSVNSFAAQAVLQGVLAGHDFSHEGFWAGAFQPGPGSGDGAAEALAAGFGEEVGATRGRGEEFVGEVHGGRMKGEG